MERCPKCGQLSRLGAKFCTTCGQRLSGEENGQGAVSAEAAPALHVPAAESPPTNSESQDQPEQNEEGGWPAAPAPVAPAAELAWAPPANGAATTPMSSESADETVNGEAWPGVWPAAEATTWPAPQTPPEPDDDAPAEAPETIAVTLEAEQESETAAAAQEIAEEVTEQELVAEAAVEAAAQEQNGQARERAAQLLDELREVIAKLGGEAPRDLSGVISELEVAVTPPGAIDTEKLSVLREALLKARERPRDLDTIVDLTARIDALVALVIAYDRTIAAIERSLEVLRGETRVMGDG